jgi:hypothetical protein
MTLYRSWAGVRQEFTILALEWIMVFPLFAYVVILTFHPMMFAEAPHYAYLNQRFDPATWELIFLCILTGRASALFTRTFLGWPWFTPLRLVTSLAAASLWLQFLLSFVASYAMNGTIPGPIAPYGALVLIEAWNVVVTSRDVGEWIKERRNNASMD